MRSYIEQYILDWYNGTGRDLIPIDMSPGISQGKKPLDHAWTTRTYEWSTIEAVAKQGGNLGYRLGPDDLVIDVDIKDGGAEGRAALEAMLGFRLSQFYPTVCTGGGGWHYYTKLPIHNEGHPQGALACDKPRYTLDEYKGVQFKTRGQQVIIPGSVHFPSGGNLYAFDTMSPMCEPTGLIDARLLHQLTCHMVNEDTGDLEDQADHTHKHITPTQLKDLLDQLPITDFASNDLWQPMLMAAHYATKGAGKSVFTQWSLGDPNYSGHAHIIANRWDSIRDNRSLLRSAGTIYRQVILRKGRLPWQRTAEQDFGPPIQGAPALAQGVPVAESQPIAQGVPVAESQPIAQTNEPASQANAVIDRNVAQLEKSSPQAEVERVLGLLLSMNLGPLDTERHLKTISKRTGHGLSLLRSILKKQRGTLAHALDVSLGKLDTEAPEDMGERLSTIVLDQWYQEGKLLIHATDQEFYGYNGTHWVHLQDNIIDQKLHQGVALLRKENPDANFQAASLMQSAKRILVAKCATSHDLLQRTAPPKPVINVNNCEVWVDPMTGRVEAREHRPDSYLSTCLDVAYDPAAQCPWFDYMLDGIFSLQPDKAEVIRHVWEIIGYTSQPNKNIAAWFLLHGRGNNGKTVFLSVMSALLGEASLEKSIGEFDLTKSKHALADLPGKLLVIDEDTDVDTILPASFLKKVSENKSLTAEPKYRNPFKFKSVAVIMLACNGWPKTIDISEGLRRRAYVIPFNRHFAPHEERRDLASHIIPNELPGILNKAIAGLQRLRARDRFLVPESCLAGRDKWLYESNNTAAWVSTCIKGILARAYLSELYGDYISWASYQGIKKPLSKRSFSTRLNQLGFVKSMSQGRVQFIGIEPTKKE